MLRALLERGIHPDVVVGTSAGALNGSGIAADPSLRGVDHLATVWSALRTEHIFPGGRFGRAWSLLSGGDHLYSNAGLAGLIDQHGAGVEVLRAARSPSGSSPATWPPARRSSWPPARSSRPCWPAPPCRGASRPSSTTTGRLVDGGVVDNVPLSHALAGPVDRIFVLNVSGGVADAPVRNPLDVVLRAFAIARNQRFERELAFAPAHVEIVVLPRPADGRSPFDFSGAETIIDEAHILAGRFLDARRAPDRHRPPPPPLPPGPRRLAGGSACRVRRATSVGASSRRWPWPLIRIFVTGVQRQSPSALVTSKVPREPPAGDLPHHAAPVDPVGHGEGVVDVLAAPLDRDGEVGGAVALPLLRPAVVAVAVDAVAAVGAEGPPARWRAGRRRPPGSRALPDSPLDSNVPELGSRDSPGDRLTSTSKVQGVPASSAAAGTTVRPVASSKAKTR